MAYDTFRVIEHHIPCQHVREYPHAIDGDEETELLLAVKQYVPLTNTNPKDGDITIIGAHAIGFGKECYEPLWEDLADSLRDAGVGVRGIWFADAANHGASYVLNEEKLGNEPSWQDHARDLLQMVNHFRAEIKRPIVGVAHSMGACNLVDLALMHPRLFTTLVLLEPAIAPVLGVRGNWLPPLMSAQRRDTWPSRALARQMFLKNPFYRRWDARVLDRYVSHGLRDLPTRLYPAGEGVTLTTPRDQEVLSFLRPNLPDNNDDDDDNDGHSHSHRRHQLVNPDTEPLSAVDVAPFYCPAPVATFHRLPALRPSVLYIIGTDTSHRIDEKLAVTGVGVGGSGGAAERRVKHVQLRASHFLPFEAEVLSQATSEAARWIADEMELWRQFERQRRQVWDGLPSSERQRMARGALEVLMKGPPRGKGNMASL